MRASARSGPSRDVLPRVLGRQDHRGVHGDHGQRGPADPRGAAHRCLEAESPGTESCGPPGAAATGRGRAQESAQGRDAAGAGRQVAVPAGAGDVLVPALLTFAVIPFATPLPTPWGDVD